MVLVDAVEDMARDDLLTRFFAAIAPALVLGLTACATSPAREANDPFEPFNRGMFSLNDGLDRSIFEPIAKGYRSVTNEPVRRSMSDFTNNLGEPVTFVNQILQLKLDNAASTAGRFAINSTLGVIGLFDLASTFGLDRTQEDFGQTLGVWGVASGPYLVMPVLGATSPRDLLGAGLDIELNPLGQFHFNGDLPFRTGVVALRAVSRREQAVELIDGVRKTQLDPYTTMKQAHLRSRSAAVLGSLPAPAASDDLSDSELDF